MGRGYPSGPTIVNRNSGTPARPEERLRRMTVDFKAIRGHGPKRVWATEESRVDHYGRGG